MKFTVQEKGGLINEKPAAKRSATAARPTMTSKMRKTISNSKGQQKTPTLKEELLSAYGNELTVWKDAQEIMEEFHITARTLHNWRKQKKIPFTKRGGKILYNRTLFDKMLLRDCVIGD